MKRCELDAVAVDLPDVKVFADFRDFEGWYMIGGAPDSLRGFML